MAQKMRGRLQTPADDQGNRIDIAVLTDVDSVIYDEEQTLHEYLDGLQTTVDRHGSRIENSGQVVLSTMEPSATDTGFYLFAEINKPKKDEVDYRYEKYTALTEELIKLYGAKKIVANGQENFDPTTMIKLGDLMAYDDDEEWEVNTYVVKLPKVTS